MNLRWRRILVSICMVVALYFGFPEMSIGVPGSDSLALLNTGLHAETLSTQWIDAQLSGEIVYFLFQSYPRIERYDLNTQAWLPSILLDAIPSAFTVDETGLYVGFARTVARFDLDGYNKQLVRNTDTDVISLHTTSLYLYIDHSSYPYGRLQSVEKLTGNLIDSETYLYAVLNGTSVAPTTGRLFARDSGISPSDIVQITLHSDGSLGTALDSPYHGAYPGATRVYVLPGESRVVDNAGIIYNAADLTYSNNLGGRFDDISFYGDLPIVLRDDKLFAYSNTFLETGLYTPQHAPMNIFVHEENIYSFYPETTAVGIEVIPIDLLTPGKPNEPIDPTGLAYVPDQVLLGNGEIVYLLSRSFQSIFRWSVEQRAYLETIPLLEAPTFVAYSQTNNRLYVTYFSGKMTQIKVSESLAEEVFANAPAPPCGLSTAGEFVFACVPVGARVSHFTYSATGQLISQVEWNYRSDEYVWSATNSKMYFFRDDTSPNDLLWEEINANGEIGNSQDSPYHDSAGFIHPIRVSPDGNFVLLGSGRIYNAASLEQIDALANNITDAIWLNGQLFTLRSTTASGVSSFSNGASQLQKWGWNYNMEISRGLRGTSGRLFPIVQGLLAVTQHNGVPWFSIWDSEFNEIYQAYYEEHYLPAIAYLN